MRFNRMSGYLAVLALSGHAAAFECTITPAVQTVTSGQSMILSASCNNTQAPTKIELLNGENVVAQVAPTGTITPVTGPFAFVTTASSATPSGAYAIRVTTGEGVFSTPSSYVGVVVPSYTVTASDGDSTHGDITPSSRTVNQGETASFTVTPADGYYASATSNCGATVSSQTAEFTYTTNAVNASGCQVTASFTLQPVAVDGACGSADGGTNLTSAPTTNLCSVGQSSNVTTGSSTYTWTCSGSNGGTPDSCSATRQVSNDPTTCGTMPSNTTKMELSNFGTSANPKYPVAINATIALRFTPTEAFPNGRLTRSASMPTTAAISACPGVMTNTSPYCVQTGRASNDGSIYFSTTGVAGKCPLVNGQPYYLNIHNSGSTAVNATVVHYW